MNRHFAFLNPGDDFIQHLHPHPYADIVFIRNENALTNDLHRHIGRSHLCVIQEHYLDLFSITSFRDDKDVFPTPLFIAAAKAKDLKSVEHLLQNTEVDKDCRNRYGETVVLLALKEKVDEGIINVLLDYGCNVIVGCVKAITPLHVAAFENKVDLMHKLIMKGADVNAASHIGVTPLHLAVLASQYEAVCLLLKYNADPARATGLEFTPLMLALAFRDINLRICELLCSYDLNVNTRIANPIYCAVKGNHLFADKLVTHGADVNYIGNIHGYKTSCILESVTLNDKHLFQLIWAKVDQNIFKKALVNFLEHFVDNCGLKGPNLVECLLLVLNSPNSVLLLNSYFNKRKRTFLEDLLEKMGEFQLTNDNCCVIISALPVVFYQDVACTHRKFSFDKELEILLKSYEYLIRWTLVNRYSSIYFDCICYNRVYSSMSNLKEFLHFLKFCTPTAGLRSQFFGMFSALAVSSDVKLDKLRATYKLCEEKLVKRTIGSLQELCRDKVRMIMFAYNKKPYKAISDLFIPEIIKEILFLKMPIYC